MVNNSLCDSIGLCFLRHPFVIMGNKNLEKFFWLQGLHIILLNSYLKPKLIVTQFFAGLLQVTISLSKVELSVGESKFFTCTGMYYLENLR